MAWLVVPVAAILAVSVWLSYGSALRQATLVMDRNLTASARIIAEQIAVPRRADRRHHPARRAGAVRLGQPRRSRLCGHRADAAMLIAGFPGLAPPADLPPEFESRFFETTFRTNEDMRAVILRQPVVTPSATVTVSVIVGETQKARQELFRTLWLRGFAEQAALVLAAALAIWIGINRELRPLLRLRQAVLASRPTASSRSMPNPCSPKIRPLVDALNRHMERLRQHLDRQKRFLDHAAHQLAHAADHHEDADRRRAAHPTTAPKAARRWPASTRTSPPCRG